MSSTRVLLTGFGAFYKVAENPSGAVARELHGARVDEVEVVGGELPVTLDGSAEALDALLAGLPRPPDAILCLGVQRDPWFRLEHRARAALRSVKPDNEGRVLRGTVLDGEPELATELLLAPLAGALRAGGARDVRVSVDAGGFICERVYHHALTRARELSCPALFLHLPRLDAVPLTDQVRAVRTLLPALAAQLRAPASTP